MNSKSERYNKLFKMLCEKWQENNIQMYFIEDNYFHQYEDDYIKDGLFKIDNAIEILMKAYKDLSDQVYEKEINEPFSSEYFELIRSYGEQIRVTSLEKD